MTHYQDIHLIPDEMAGEPTLMNLLFGRLHKALASMRSKDIGLSFPMAAKNLGAVLRLHGSREALEKLDALGWTGPLSDYINKGKILPVPEKVRGYRTVSRKQLKSNPDRLRRRLAKRHGITLEEAKMRIPDSAAQISDLPFLQVKSSSTDQHFRLFVDQGPIRDKAEAGEFSFYGMSATATIPFF